MSRLLRTRLQRSGDYARIWLWTLDSKGLVARRFPPLLAQRPDPKIGSLLFKVRCRLDCYLSAGPVAPGGVLDADHMWRAAHWHSVLPQRCLVKVENRKALDAWKAAQEQPA